MRARILYAITSATLPMLAIACNSLLNIQEGTPLEAGTPQPDAAGPAPAPDATVPSGDDAGLDGASPSADAGLDGASPSADAGLDGASPSADAGLDANDAGVDAGFDATPTYHDAADPSFWTSVTLGVDAAAFPRFAGGTFDGRYIYAPTMTMNGETSAGLVRYDTQGTSFDAGWQAMVLAQTSDNVQLLPWGAVYDGVAVTLVPGDQRTVPAAYPTSAPFDPSSITSTPGSAWWTPGSQHGSCGGTTVPSQDGGASNVLLAPYEFWSIDGLDTNRTVALFDGTAWQYRALYEPVTFNSVGYFCGAVFDGQYVYFIPSVGAYGALDYVRFNTKLDATLAASFADANAWEFVKVAADAGAYGPGFFGGVFDGRYVYYVPYDGTVVARFDTHAASLGDPSAWERFDLTSLPDAGATGFQGGAFDGRFVYLIPTTTSPKRDDPRTPRAQADAGVPPLVRYDTQDPNFTQPQPWQTFDLHGVDPNVAGFTGGVFDGQYLYLVPAQGSTFLRFNARDPNGQGVPGFSHGSFF